MAALGAWRDVERESGLAFNVDFTAGYDTNSAVLFPETVATRELAKFYWGGIFCDREAARFRKVVAGSDRITASAEAGGTDTVFTLELMKPYYVICEDGDALRVTVVATGLGQVATARARQPEVFTQPVLVQATYACASAIIASAVLSFLGVGISPEVPSWGNIIAQGRTFFQIAPWTILIPGTFLAITVLAVNLLGDGLRDRLDPRLARRL